MISNCLRIVALIGCWGSFLGDLTAEEPVAKGSAILDAPYDFSQPPTLPEIDEPTADEIRASIARGIDFLVEFQLNK